MPQSRKNLLYLFTLRYNRQEKTLSSAGFRPGIFEPITAGEARRPPMISTKGRYAIRVMLDLAQQNEDGFVPLKDIAERQEISKKYLEIIVKDMVAGGLLVGASGKGGGYRLVKKPEKYTIGEILELVEGPLVSVACLADKNYDCPRRDKCLTLPMWQEYDAMVHDFFYGRHLSDLLEPKKPVRTRKAKK